MELTPQIDIFTPIKAFLRDGESWFQGAARQGVEFAMWQHGGDIGKAAKELGVPRAELVSKLRRFGMLPTAQLRVVS